MKKWIGPVAAVVLLGAAFGLLRWELDGVSWLQIRSGLSAVRPGGLAAALALTALNYLILTGYDALGLRFAGVHLDRARVALAATLGTAFTQGLGFPLLTGAPVRTRLYSSWGLSTDEVGDVVRYYTLAFWLGFAALASVSLLGVPAGAAGVSEGTLRVAGGALALGIAAFVARSKTVRAPRLLAGLAVGALDWIVASLVLWVLLPAGHGLGFGTVLVSFVLAQGLGVASRIPGGIGVFEAAFLALLPGRGAPPEVLASLLAYRAVYYLAPLILATVALGIREVRTRTDRYGVHALGAARVASQLVPTASAALAFVLGSLLLLSGSVPTPTGRLAALGALVPAGVVELSHFLASLVGVSLIVVARGLQLRLDGAFTLALAALVMGALLALSHDLNLVGAAAFLTGAAVLYASRREFYRRASLLDQPFTPSWVLAIGAVMAAAIWLGLFAFRQVDYSSDLWWRFALQEDAPRFLRASVGASVALAVFVGTRLLRPAPVEEPPVDSAALDELAPLVRAAANPAANLVFLGDKRVRRSASGGSFVMFAPSGSSWVVMGDPVGDPAEFEPLLWAVNEEADRAGADLVFYEVGPAHLPLYIDLGLVFYKLGENARIPLEGFSMEGKARGDMRQALRRLEKEGGTFDVVGVDAVESILPRLREISDQWLESKRVREKRFSLGRFDEAYVRRFPVGVVRVNGAIVAFATLWAGTSREELSPDLIRYTDDAPKMVMDALFTHLMLWGCDQGYRWFNLGMAPFSGLETHRLAPSWQRLGSALFRFGEHFYNFQGLRTYKEKFAPVWEPRYLAAPPGPGITGIMADVTGLVSGGIRGAVMR